MRRLVITERTTPIPHVEGRCGRSWEGWWDRHAFLLGFVVGAVGTMLLVLWLLW